MKQPRLQVRPRSVVQALCPYAAPAPRGPIDLRLDANEGPLPGSAALEAVRLLSGERLRRYPNKAAVEALLAERFGRSPRDVLVTAGGDDAIDRCCRAVLEPGRTMVQHIPTFEMIERSARLAGARRVDVEWAAGDFPLDEMIRHIDVQTSMIAVVSPNNPTGLAAPAGAILKVAEAAPGAMVLVDLAYVEFADFDPTADLLAAPNVVIVRTFSKAAGLAGLRLGCAIGDQRVIDWLRTVGGPYPTSVASLAVAEAVLRAGGPADAYVAQVRSERQRLHELLLELGLDALPSEANFVLARHPRSAEIHAALLGRGISVRAFPGHSRPADALRVTCPGDAREFLRLQRDLRAVMEELNA